MDYEYLARLLFPDINTAPEDMEKRYPPRNLPQGAKVTRFAPSPTGFMHLGNLYGALTDERLAHQSDGVFFLRIEDTDDKRSVENGVALIIEALKKFGLAFDEGATAEGDSGDYGPYRQSERKEIYQTYAKELVRKGKAYPCFCTEEELAGIRTEQEAEKLTPGYYGKWAKWRGASIEDIEEKLRCGCPFVLRFYSEGNAEHKLKFTDMIKGDIDVTENDIDHVLLKSDGIPTYHFAHAVDDHLMRTTHVVRDESWLSTLPFHIQLFSALGFRMPKYCHTAQVMKLDNGGKRKLSKRKDPEAALSFYSGAGYPSVAVREYLMSLLNSNFEEWRTANPSLPLEKFPFSTKKMSTSGCLFSFDKLNDVSKNIISTMTAEEVYGYATDWAKEYDAELYAALAANPDYTKRIFAIGRGGNKPRKDLCTWADCKAYMGFFYDEFFKSVDPMPNDRSADEIKKALEMFNATYDPNDDQNAWFEKLKDIAESLGYARETKLWKKNPQDYKGHVGDIAAFIRIAVTGKANSPDLYECMQILGKDRVSERISGIKL